MNNPWWKDPALDPVYANMKRGFWTILTLFVAIPAAVLAAAYAAHLLKPSPEQIVRDMVEASEGSTPIREDGVTLYAISGNRNVIWYEYKIDQSVDEIDVGQFEIEMGRLVESNSCSNNETRRAIDAGVAFGYFYIDRDESLIAEFYVSDC